MASKVIKEMNRLEPNVNKLKEVDIMMISGFSSIQVLSTKPSLSPQAERRGKTLQVRGGPKSSPLVVLGAKIQPLVVLGLVTLIAVIL